MVKKLPTLIVTMFLVVSLALNAHVFFGTTEMKTGSYTITHNGWNTSIYFSNTIQAPKAYDDLIIYINNHPEIEEYNVYLAGNGGSVASVVRLINVMKHSGAKFNAIVYGNVYSAHAVLAMNLTTLKVINPQTLFLFHRPAVNVLGQYEVLESICEKIPNTVRDRGVSFKAKCFQFAKQSEESYNKSIMVKPFSVLTKDEIARYKAGDDVIVTYKEMKENQGG